MYLCEISAMDPGALTQFEEETVQMMKKTYKTGKTTAVRRAYDAAWLLGVQSRTVSQCRGSVSMSPRRSAPGPEPTPDLSRSPSSRSGATCPLRSPASPKLLLQLKIPSQDNNMSLSLPFESIFIIDLFIS